MFANLLQRFRAGGGSITVSGGRRQLRPAFRPRARIAVLEAPQIASGRRVRHFRISERRRLAGFRHEVLASGIEHLLALDGTWLPRPTHAVIAFTQPGGTMLDDAVRRRLWERFEVPVFEQMEWPDGTLLAEECEAHWSLHLRSSSSAMDRAESGETILMRIAPNGDAMTRIETADWIPDRSSVCACGEIGPRLVRQPVVIRARAAVACG